MGLELTIPHAIPTETASHRQDSVSNGLPDDTMLLALGPHFE